MLWLALLCRVSARGCCRADMLQTPALFKYAREQLGDEIELCHDVHERLNPSQTVWLAKELEPYRLFFLEDSLPPEQNDHFKHIRNHSTVPIAMGELFVNVHEYVPLIKERMIDFIRVHMSDIGGSERRHVLLPALLQA